MNKDKDERDEFFAAGAKTLFDDSVDSLDAERLSKLNQARQRALGELERGPEYLRWQRLVPAGGAVAAAAVVGVMLLGPDESGVDLPLAPTTAETDFELLINEDSLEMLEDLEFYSWLSTEEFDEIDASERES